MFIVLIEQGENKKIGNIVYTKDIEIVREWIYNYLIKEIDLMQTITLRDVSGYKITENLKENEYQIVREYKRPIRGYFTTSYKTEFEYLLKATILEYTDSNAQKKKFLEQYHKILIEKQKKSENLIVEEQQEKQKEKEKRD